MLDKLRPGKRRQPSLEADLQPPSFSVRINKLDSVYVISVRLFSAVSQAAILFLIARNTTIAQFGLFSVALATTAIVSAFCGFGWTAWILRLRAEGRGRLSRPVLRLASASVVISAIAVLSVLTAISGPHLALLAASAVSMADAIGLACQNLLFGDLRPKRATTTLLLCRLVSLVAVVLAMLLSESVFTALMIGSALSIVISFTMAGRQSREYWTWKEVISGGVQYWKVSIWGMAQQLDVIIVGAMMGKAPAGAYAAGFRLASPVHIITSSLNSIFVPKLSHEKRLEARNAQGGQLIRFGLIYSGALIVASPLAYYAGPFLLGSQFQQYATIFPIFVINSALSVNNQLQATRYYANGVASFVARSSMISTIAGLLFIVSAIAFLGNIYVAASGTILIQILLTIFLFVGSKRRLNNAS